MVRKQYQFQDGQDEGQYTTQEFGQVLCSFFHSFFSREFSRVKGESNLFVWPPLKCSLCKESASNAPAKHVAHSANMPKKCWSTRHCIKATGPREKILKRDPWDFRDGWEVSRACELIPHSHLLSGFESLYFITGVILKWLRSRTTSSPIVTGNRRPGKQIPRTAHFLF